jgi:hypothetical protein
MELKVYYYIWNGDRIDIELPSLTYLNILDELIKLRECIDKNEKYVSSV